MEGNHHDEIDDILDDVLPDKGSLKKSADSTSSFTIAQSVSDRDRQNIIEQRIETLAVNLDVPDATVRMAKSLRDQYRDQRGNLIGTALEIVAASCLYCACKVNEIPLDPTDFVNAGEGILTRRALLRRTKDIAATVGLDPSAFVGSGHYVDRYCAELNVTEGVRERAHEIVRITEDHGLSSGKSPSGWAAAAVYNACLDTGTEITQTTIAELANVSEVTIRNRYQEQRDALRDIEAFPSRPDVIVEQIGVLTNASDAVRSHANELVEKARSVGVPIDDKPVIWTLAALHRAGQRRDEPIGWLTLSQFTDESSDVLQRHSRALRKVRSGALLSWTKKNESSKE